MTTDKWTIISDTSIDNHLFSANISLPHDGFNSKNTNIVLIFGNQQVAQNFRKCSELFFNHFKNITIYDGGHIVGVSDESFEYFANIFNENIFLPVFIGCDLVFVSRIIAHNNLKICKISNNTFPLDEKSNLNNLSFVGYQRHLSQYDDIVFLENYSYNSLSLGKMRTFPSLTEAVLRDVNGAFIDFNVVKWSECRYSNGNLPTGLTAEELCQVSKYLGGASHLNSVFIDGGQLLGSSNEMGLLASEVVWYLLEGINFRYSQHPENSNDFSEFIVVSNEMEVDLIFLKSKSYGLWWVKLESNDSTKYLACTFEEYEAALNDDISDRILKFIQSV